MRFNSFIFILLFLPLTALLYFLANRFHKFAGKMVLFIASIIFYAYSDWYTLIILGISCAVNYLFSILITKTDRFGEATGCEIPPHLKGLRYRMWGGVFLLVVVNVGLLLYFKYSNFAITNINTYFTTEIALKELILPIGISFFTFQQIAYIVAIYRKEIDKNSLIDYLVFILYFPKILMGPLTDPVDFIGQLNDESRKRINWENIACGIKIFSLGLFKKVMIADVFSKAVSWGYTNYDAATSADWFLVMLFYTFEIYFDFSGYSDMAVGASMMFNITLPVNFDSPYKAISIRDFWKRWHISLTRFFTKYIYIPLGGSRKGIFFTCFNTMLVFLVSGIWHGANWTFILWGLLHGAFSILDRFTEKYQKNIFEPARWICTFTTVNILWLLFRSDSINQWRDILNRMICFQNTTVSDGLINSFVLQESSFINDVLRLDWYTENIRGFWMMLYILISYAICLVFENNYKKLRHNSWFTMIISAVVFVWGFICLSGESVFVYFNF